MANTETVKKTSKRNKELVFKIKRSYGRDSFGHISSRYKSSGGHKKLYRKISFRRALIDIKGITSSIEYDPFRNCKIALIEYETKEKEYILAPEGLKVGDEVIASNEFSGDLKPGHAMPLKVMPIGTIIHNVEMRAGFGGQIARSAGTFVTLIDRNDKTAILQLPSGETRMVPSNCFGSIGVISNAEFINKPIGKAGTSRHLGIRPHVRGIAKNPVDHPHGGRTNGGRIPVTPWGKVTKGLKTRKKKASDKMIIRRRNKKGN
jgi:large subunit ribosomal protein L2